MQSRAMKTEPLKTYRVQVRKKDELQYGQWITAPTKEDAINLFVAEYLDVRFVRVEEEQAIETLRRQNTELQAEVDTLKAYIRGQEK